MAASMTLAGHMEKLARAPKETASAAGGNLKCSERGRAHAKVLTFFCFLLDWFGSFQRKSDVSQSLGQVVRILLDMLFYHYYCVSLCLSSLLLS